MSSTIDTHTHPDPPPAPRLGVRANLAQFSLLVGVNALLLQALAITAIATLQGFAWWAAAAALLGVGTALVYPTLLAAIGDVAHPSWRAASVGVYRLWRDAGFAVGALVTGVIADLAGARAAILSVAVLTAASGVVVAVRMVETLRPRASSS